MAVNRRLQEVADDQWGYFTSRQASLAGYTKDLQRYHHRCGNWEKIDRALYRLPGFPDSRESVLTRWCLWAAGQSEGRQVVVSHESALFYYGLLREEPEAVHLSVSSFRHQHDLPGVVLHWQTVTPEDCSVQAGFVIQTPCCALRTMCADLTLRGTWTATVRLASAKGFLNAEEAAGLLPGASAEHVRRGWRIGAAQREISHMDNTAELQESAPPDGRATRLLAQRLRENAGRGLAQAGRSFTLVEMLVVVAIIFTMMALLQPALLQAVGQARSSSCQNNLRLFGICVSNYLNDNADWVPYAGLYPTTYRDPVYGWLAQYVNPGDLGRAAFVDNTAKYAHVYASTPTFMTCPVFPRPWGSQQGIRCAWANGNYGMNYKIAPTRMNNVNWSYPRKSGSLRSKPYAKMLATDLGDDGNYFGGNAWSAGWCLGVGNVTVMDGRHPGETANVLFVDLHIGPTVTPVPTSETDFWLP